MKAIIFDLDGTLIDSRRGIFWQYEELTREFNGAPASRQQIAAAMHGTPDAVMRTLVPSPSVALETLRARHAQLWEASDGQHELYPGVRDLLAILKRLGVRVAAVTASDARTVLFLDKAGVGQHFDVVITNADYTLPKPHPEGLLLAMQKLGVQPHEAIMVGDTAADIQAGKNAGVAKAIAIAHGFGTHESLLAAAPDHIVGDIPSLLDVVE